MSPSTLEFTIKKTLVDGFLTIDRGWVINLIGQFVYVGTARNPRLRLSAKRPSLFAGMASIMAVNSA